ncbi:carbohydrate-binding domain-containing protein [Demequina sp. B12]|uniref:carbohydrate-binding domain-containing protein n=1 Tax=Demequina sp. B12 TaxID=2992757 RepID=UPI00237AB697|nr:carbohydrate-binding domain-containing protein [Demequina sp. B12]MDE0572225.1 carbohydrate-binding domain-containing protein [Demequina sp. B12]
MKHHVFAKTSAVVAGTALLLTGCSLSSGDVETTTEATATTGGSADDSTSTDTATTTASDTTDEAIAIGDRVEATYADLEIEEVDLDYSTAGATTITLADGASTVDGSGATVDGDTVTITESGTYVLSGELSAGQVVVNGDKADVVLVLDGVDITAADVSGINVVDADWVVLALAAGSTNVVSDAADAVDADDAETNAAIYSTADLWITGEGSLQVNGVAADGITSKDTLVVNSGDLTVTATDDGLRGKDHLVVLGGVIEVDAGGDGLKADNVSDSDDTSYPVGVVWISDGTLNVTSGVDAIDAENQVTIENGTLSLAAGDDGITTNGIMRVTDGTIDVTTSVEGFEAAIMYLDGGTGSIVSSDDGFNATDGSTSSGNDMGGGMGGDTGGPGGERGERSSRPGEDTTDGASASTTPDAADTSTTVTTAAYSSSDASEATVEQTAGGMGGMDAATEGVIIEISGGTWSIDAAGDGVDSNGDVLMTDGVVVVAGPTNSGNGAVDYNGSFQMDGGTFVASGSAGMAQAPDSGSQAVIGVSFGQTITAGTPIAVLDEDGTLVAAYTSTKDSQTLVISSPDLTSGDSYTVTFGGTVTGTATAGLVTDGSISGSETAGTVTAS